MKKAFCFVSEDAEYNLRRAFALQQAIGEEECQVFLLEFPTVAVVPVTLAATYEQQGYDHA